MRSTKSGERPVISFEPPTGATNFGEVSVVFEFPFEQVLTAFDILCSADTNTLNLYLRLQICTLDVSKNHYRVCFITYPYSL